MDRIPALFWALGIAIIALLILGNIGSRRPAVNTTVQPQVVINNPDQVVVSDRTTVSDTVPATQTTTVQTYPAQPPVTQIYPRACAGTCTTACPGVVTSGYCPAGYLCCV